jgi:hypothetical protein
MRRLRRRGSSAALERVTDQGVEDETLVRLWAADLLEENGFSVLEAEEADALLNYWKLGLT